MLGEEGHEVLHLMMLRPVYPVGVMTWEKTLMLRRLCQRDLDDERKLEVWVVLGLTIWIARG